MPAWKAAGAESRVGRRGGGAPNGCERGTLRGPQYTVLSTQYSVRRTACPPGKRGLSRRVCASPALGYREPGSAYWVLGTEY